MSRRHIGSRHIAWLLAFAWACMVQAALAQEGRLVREMVHGASLEKNVTGELSDRMVSIYLPPGYDSSAQRYAVLFILHGIFDTDEQWIKAWRAGDEWGTIQDVMDRGISEGRYGEMIVVIPDQKTQMAGSFYTNSAATGNWEDFTVKDLVSYVDTKYRTLARGEHRGIAGHSMGGYGALKLAMKHPDVFSVAYGMNPALLGWAGDLLPDNPAFVRALTVTPDQLMRYGFYVPALLCVAQAFSPDASRPPFFARLPYEIVDGRLAPSEPAFSQWEQNMPLNMVKDYRENLLKLRGIRFDTGNADEFTHIPVTSRALSDRLTSLGVPHVFEEYNGDHRNRLWGRNGRMVNDVLPYFWNLLGLPR